MRERPILFSSEMVRALLEGRKTQTRRPMLLRDKPDKPCPYGQPGDRLWVREAWGGDDLCGIAYRADHPDWKHFEGDGDQPDSAWKPSIHMPRWMCRIVLELVSVRFERLQQITEADARAEGLAPTKSKGWDGKPCELMQAVDKYEELWDQLNGKRAPWAINPMVWVLEFRRVDGVPSADGESASPAGHDAADARPA